MWKGALVFLTKSSKSGLPFHPILLTFNEQCGGLGHSRHLVLHNTSIVARVPGLQVRDGQHGGEGVNARHPHRVVQIQVLAISEPWH